jgi:hypothetical protein
MALCSSFNFVWIQMNKYTEHIELLHWDTVMNSVEQWQFDAD